MDKQAIKTFLEKRELLDSPESPASEKVKQRMHKMFWSCCTIMVVTLPTLFKLSPKEPFFFWPIMILFPMTYFAFGYEIYRAWQIKRRFEAAGARTLDELLTPAANSLG